MKKSPLAVILCNLGTPEAPTPAAVRAFLKPFLSDPRVVEVPRPIWWLVLNLFILPLRPRPVAAAYQALWDEYGDSPLRIISKRQVAHLQDMLDESLGEGEVLVDYAFTYGHPGIDRQLDTYRNKADKILLLPLYPQYSCSTTAAIYDQVAGYNLKQRDVVDVSIVKDYYSLPSYREALAQTVTDYWQEHGKSEHLLISNHGVPKSYADNGDPYYQQCLTTAENLIADLELDKSNTSCSFQSRVGKAEWLQPYTDTTVRELAEKGVKTVDVVCPSFSVDCLETLEEITVENGGYFTEAGGEKLRLIPCLNDRKQHIEMMAEIILPYYQQIKKTHE